MTNYSYFRPDDDNMVKYKYSYNHQKTLWRHYYWSFVHKGQRRGALMFSLICAWINGWVNNREAGDLRRHRAHYDVIVTVMSTWVSWKHTAPSIHFTTRCFTSYYYFDLFHVVAYVYMYIDACISIYFSCTSTVFPSLRHIVLWQWWWWFNIPPTHILHRSD